MMSWDLVFWSNKESVDYIPSSWAVDELRYKWPQGVSQEVRQGLIDTCHSLQNIKYRISKGTARKKGITDLQKAKELCEKALYTSSVETTDVEMQSHSNNGSETSDDDEEFGIPNNTFDQSTFRNVHIAATGPAFTPPNAGGPGSTGKSSKSNRDRKLDEALSGTFSDLNHSDEDLVPLKELAHPSTHSRKSDTTLSNCPGSASSKTARKSLFLNHEQSLKKQKVCSSTPPLVCDNNDENHIELATNTTGDTVSLTASERLVLREIKKMNWEIGDLKKTVNKIHDLLVTNNVIGLDIATEEPWELPIENMARLELFEQLLMRDEKNVDMLSKRLYLCGGDTVHKAVFLSMKKLLSKEVALLHSGSGKKGKLSFQKLTCYTAITKSVRKRFPNATDLEINKSISLYLAGAGDRGGGRKAR